MASKPFPVIERERTGAADRAGARTKRAASGCAERTGAEPAVPDEADLRGTFAFVLLLGLFLVAVWASTFALFTARS